MRNASRLPSSNSDRRLHAQRRPAAHRPLLAIALFLVGLAGLGPAIGRASVPFSELPVDATPPIVANSGLSAFFGGLRLPPGRQASVISFAAMPKKNTMKMSLIRK